VGEKVGIEVGGFEGCSVGDDVGIVVGKFVGDSDGM